MTAIVMTRQGEVQGRLSNGVHMFMGIPFARRRSGLGGSWRRNRSNRGGACGTHRVRPKPPQLPYPPPGCPYPGASCHREDCLNLNVWTPEPGRSAAGDVWIAAAPTSMEPALAHV